MDVNAKIDDYIAGFKGWRGDRLSLLRSLINEAAPDLKEDFKWNVPVWSRKHMVCAISAFKDHVKINFFKGVYLPDPDGIINSGMDSKEHRSINFTEDDKVNEAAVKTLVKAAAQRDSQ